MSTMLDLEHDIQQKQPPFVRAPGQLAHPNEVSALFIGNSYIMANDLMKLLTSLARQEGHFHSGLAIKLLAVGGGSINDRFLDGSASKALSSRHWDWVVLQEQSMWALREEWAERIFKESNHWRGIIEPNTRQIGLIETWPRCPNSRWYEGRNANLFISPDWMWQQTNKNTNKLSRLLGASTIPVGTQWKNEGFKASLYVEDGSHPSLEGTALMADTILNTIKEI